MTKEELDAHAKDLAESQMKFVKTLVAMSDVLEGLDNYLRGFGERLATNEKQMKSQAEEFKAAFSAFQAMVKAVSETNVAVSANTEKLDKVISKMESYFGSGAGLEYDN